MDAAPDGFMRHGPNLEPMVGDLGGGITPVERFFVCSAGPAPEVDRDEWRLTIDGDAAATPTSLSLAELLEYETHAVPAWLECAGNGRRLFHLIDGALPTDGFDTPWTLGAMGQAVWGGVRVADVLERVGVDTSAVAVGAHGPDSDAPDVDGVDEHVAMSLPLAKALHPDTIIAVQMNGEPLAADHGAPARLVVPGWIGAYWVKWLDRLEVSSARVGSWRGDEYYVERSPGGEPGESITAHPVKSTLALPWEAELPEGPRTIRGYARSGSGAITAVEVSVDGGPWFPAAITPTYGEWAWTLFEFSADLEPGDHVIRTRAHDSTGAAQPDTQPFNPNRLLRHCVTPHPVRILG